MSETRTTDLPDLEPAELSESQRSGLQDLARFVILNELMTSQEGLFHNTCSTCQQYETAVLDYIKLCVDAPASTIEDSKSILMLTHEIWLEHHIEDYRSYTETRRRHIGIIERSMDESKPPPTTAADEEISSLETKAYEEKDEKKSCVICLNELQEGDKTILTKCEHLFHQKCLTTWLKTNITCPMCRKNAITGENIVVEYK